MGRADLGSLLLTTTLASGVLCDALPVYLKNIDKVKGFKISMAIEAVLLIGMYFVPAGNVAAIFALVIIINIIQLAATPLQWACCPDIIDAEERTQRQKLSGIVFSTNLFAIKLGSPSAARWWAICWHGATMLAAQRSKPTRAADDQAAVHRLPWVLVGAADCYHEQVQSDDKRLSRLAQDDLPA